MGVFLWARFPCTHPRAMLNSIFFWSAFSGQHFLKSIFVNTYFSQVNIYEAEVNLRESQVTHCASHAPLCSRANSAHTRESRPDSGLCFHVKAVKTFQVVPSLLNSDAKQLAHVELECLALTDLIWAPENEETGM